jgi:hypothetical protein
MRGAHLVLGIYLILGFMTSVELLDYKKEGPSYGYLALGHLVVLGLYGIGCFQLASKGKFFGMDKALWIIGPLPAYGVGFIAFLFIR